jgi:hypothetical protein
LGIFGFRSRKKDDREPPRDDALEAAVAVATIDAPTEGDEAGDGAVKSTVTAEQRAAFEEVLLQHGLADALLVALGFAKRRTGSLLEARWYVKRARARMWENCSWDPKKGPTLRIFLCGLVRSEISADRAKEERREEAEQASLAEPSTSADEIPDPEALLRAREEKRDDDREAAADIEALRADFDASGDKVNLRWLELRSEGVEDEPAAMAARSVFTAEEFYNARKRRIRAATRLLARKENR